MVLNNKILLKFAKKCVKEEPKYYKLVLNILYLTQLCDVINVFINC